MGIFITYVHEYKNKFGEWEEYDNNSLDDILRIAWYGYATRVVEK